MKDIKRLVKQFRNAIDLAMNEGEFYSDLSFCKFPLGCCGDTSDLLSQFLLENNIRTYYVYGTYRCRSFENIQTHAWLLTDNNTIIDITGDQFKYNPDFFNYDKSVYVGGEDDFHRLFEIDYRGTHENMGLDYLGSASQPRLKELYSKIVQYIQ